MFAISFIIGLSVFAYSGTAAFLAKSIILAIVATILEAVSVKGTDNVTVPVLTSLLTYFLI